MPLGIPHSAFLGWSEDDQDKALAWSAEQRLHCPGCGTRKDEWEADPFAFISGSERCPGCELLAQERKNIEEEGSDGVRVFLVPRHLATALDEGEHE